MRDRSYDDVIADQYAEHPEEALEMLQAVMADGDLAEMLLVLRQMTKAFGGVTAIAEKASLNPTQLYRTLSADGNPSASSLLAILKAMGLKLSVTADKAA